MAPRLKGRRRGRGRVALTEIVPGRKFPACPAPDRMRDTSRLTPHPMKIPTAVPCLVLALLSSLPALRAAPAWVETSNRDAMVLLDAMAKYRPEEASAYGLTRYDPYVSDLSPGVNRRRCEALEAARATLRRDLAAESDPRVRQDLEIMIDEAGRRIERINLDERYLLPYTAVPKLVFQCEFMLLSPEAAPARHAAALERLRRYAGLVPGTQPFTTLVEAQIEARLSNPKLLGPFRTEVEQDLSNTTRFEQGLAQLFAANHVAGADEALAALKTQFAAHDAWVRKTLLPRCRTDFRLPHELYAFDLRRMGVDITPEQLIHEAELEYAEVQSEMQSLAPLVAKEHGWKQTDYRSVIHRLKQDQLTGAAVEPYYRNVVIPRIEQIIREKHLVTMPDRPMAMRVASEAESAAEPAPHMQPPPLIDNHGERGTFVLTLGNPPTHGGHSESYDDFTFPAAAWTLTAHEGRPGHELQFDRMVERGVSYARAIFAFNSVNVEGWALYCETMMKPYEPIDAQLIVLQYRLLRAARAICDPMLNLGLMPREQAHAILVHDVCLSEAFTREELDRFTFRSPAQATSYFYGFTRLMQLKAATQIALGEKFHLQSFNDFVIDQGLLPPDILAKAVQTEFIPAQEAKPAATH